MTSPERITKDLIALYQKNHLKTNTFIYRFFHQFIMNNPEVILYVTDWGIAFDLDNADSVFELLNSFLENASYEEVKGLITRSNFLKKVNIVLKYFAKGFCLQALLLILKKENQDEGEKLFVKLFREKGTFETVRKHSENKEVEDLIKEILAFDKD